MDVFEAINNRRSIGKLSAPAPSVDDVEKMLQAAMFAPDHKELRPWRFVVVHDKALRELGDVMASALLARQPDASQGQIEKERSKPLRAPMVIAVAATWADTKLPFAELVASASAATQNLLLGAHALGYGAIWRTGESATDDSVKQWLGLDARDELVAFVYVGTPNGEAPQRGPMPENAVTWLPDRPLRVEAPD